jgi:hypothetical protein
MPAGSPSLWGETAMIAGGVASCSGGRSGWEYLLMTALSEQQRAKTLAQKGRLPQSS